MGIDAGITVGIAVLDFDGNVIHLSSIRNAREGDIIRILEKYGKPVVISVDVKDPPEMASKVASHFNAKLFCPKRDLSVEEKKELTRGYKYKNIHERDALASALYFLKLTEPLLKKIDREAYEKVYKRARDEIKKKILLGESANIDDAIREIFEGKEVVKEVYIIKKSDKERDLEIKVGELRRRVREYKKEIDRLRRELRRKAKREEKRYIILDEKLKDEVDRLKKIIQRLEEELRRKEKEIEKFLEYIKRDKISLEDLSEISEIWKYLPSGITIEVKRIGDVNRKLLKILREIKPKEIVYDECEEEELKKLEEEGFVVRKRRLTKEDVIRILKG